ncbi:MAG: helix-turn-helix transcriptional regulator [Acidimicrobiales bacterium]
MVLAATLAEVLRSHGYRAIVVDTSRADRENLLAAVDRECAAGSRTIALVDLNISRELDGVELIGPLRERGVSVAVLSGVRDHLRLAEAAAAGAQALLDKADSLDILFWTLCRLEAGETALPAKSRESLLSELKADLSRNQASLAALRRLTRREAAVLQRLNEGMTAEEIADTEFVSLHTVRSQIRAVLLKLSVHSQHDAIKIVRETRWNLDVHTRLRQGMRLDREEMWPPLRSLQPGGSPSLPVGPACP